jgi:hypothetical protein
MKKSSIYLEVISKGLDFSEKASHHFKIASILLKMSLKSLSVFEKASDFLLKPSFLWKCLQRSSDL